MTNKEELKELKSRLNSIEKRYDGLTKLLYSILHPKIVEKWNRLTDKGLTIRITPYWREIEYTYEKEYGTNTVTSWTKKDLFDIFQSYEEELERIKSITQWMDDINAKMIVKKYEINKNSI